MKADTYIVKTSKTSRWAAHEMKSHLTQFKFRDNIPKTILGHKQKNLHMTMNSQQQEHCSKAQPSLYHNVIKLFLTI